MRYGLLCAFALLLLPMAPGISHPFYVSVSELQLGPKQAELSVRLFTDDFETVLRSEPGGEKVDLIKRQPKQIDSLVARYVRKQWSIQLNEQALVLQYVGFEQEEDATWVHFESPLTSPPNALRLENRLLLAHFPSQQNIVHVQLGKFKRTRRLNNDERVWELKLQGD
ncbi:MAG: hypothetical protein C0424_12355 [Sphingobacteriaceae bacterium]|nr:hypothetical protein [Sphingobacteriaceae bacterium]